VAPWRDYWSLSLYAANSDNFYVVDDREVRNGAEITLVRRVPEDADDDGATFIVSPSTRGIALIRRLAPTPSAYDDAKLVAAEDVCASAAAPVG
jgi:uncharacterized membrane protein